MNELDQLFKKHIKLLNSKNLKFKINNIKFNKENYDKEDIKELEKNKYRIMKALSHIGKIE